MEAVKTVPAPERPRRAKDDHRPKKTAMLLAQRIVGEIADRGLEPGTPLLPEKDMLEQYRVARGTLREALRFLEIQGVISIKTGPGGGPIVSEPKSRHLASIIAMMLQLDGATYRSVLEARITLEPSLARKAAERATEDDLAALHSSVVRMHEHIAEADFFLEENEIFHDLVSVAAGNQVFSLVMSSLNWICDGTALGVTYALDTREAVAKEHGRIYQAIKSRDGERAAAAMAVHIGDHLTYMERSYPQLIDAPLRWDQVQ
jgi:GntR family transcriptional regulator, transcriptional repressor for pyruvate dehydrogenase complex